MSVSLINGHIDDDVQGMTFEDVKRIRKKSNAPKWDGHSPEEAIRRISTLLINNAKKAH